MSTASWKHDWLILELRPSPAGHATGRCVIDADAQAPSGQPPFHLEPLDRETRETRATVPDLSAASIPTLPEFERQVIAAVRHPDPTASAWPPPPAASPWSPPLTTSWSPPPSRPSLPVVLPMRGLSRTEVRALLALLVVAIVACTAAVRLRSNDRVIATPIPQPPRPSVDEIPPPAPLETVPPPSGGSSTSSLTASPGTPKVGKLAVRGRAAARGVYLDGKRLLGSGARTFDVTCGRHTVAIGNKNDRREVDVECEGELVLTH